VGAFDLVLVARHDDDLHLRIREILRKKASPWTKGVVSIGYRKLDRPDANLEDVTGLGSLDVDRTGQYVTARSLVGDLFVDVAKRLFDLFGWDSGRAQFASPAASIREVGYQLSHSALYRNKDVDGILATYNSNVEYAAKVKSVMRSIAAEE